VFRKIIDLPDEGDSRSQRHGTDGVQRYRQAFKAPRDCRASGVKHGNHEDN
jgi:hypothetical protein